MKNRFINIEIVQGDITRQQVEAIVNAANTSLLGGGGVDGAIHRAAGPALLEECRTLGGCATGEAKITHGYNLPANWVIHTVGPIWRDGRHHESELLARCYRNCLRLAKERGFKTMAFPSISTGAYGFPIGQACRIALREIRNALEQSDLNIRVTIVCFDGGAYSEYLKASAELLPISCSKQRTPTAS
jgi:O-acetyl-ADP-ribose deacetylase (regulator of RNase III)